MAHEDLVFSLMQGLVIADKHVIGSIMAHKKIWTPGVSDVNNSSKALNNLSDLGKLEKGDKFYRIVGCQSNYGIHAKLLTVCLSEIIKLDYQTKIFREKTISEIGLRPDALVLLTKNNQALCFILEVCHNEFPQFLQQKVNTWRSWENALPFLSQLFETKIKAFDIVVAGDMVAEGTFNFKEYKEAI